MLWLPEALRGNCHAGWSGVLREERLNSCLNCVVHAERSPAGEFQSSSHCGVLQQDVASGVVFKKPGQFLTGAKPPVPQTGLCFSLGNEEVKNCVTRQVWACCINTNFFLHKER